MTDSKAKRRPRMSGCKDCLQGDGRFSAIAPSSGTMTYSARKHRVDVTEGDWHEIEPPPASLLRRRKGLMKDTKCRSWVVYRTTIPGKTASVMNGVCEQGEWDTMERNRPGHHTLILAGIATEGEAERVARSSTKSP
jgi:hypothetical protein